MPLERLSDLFRPLLWLAVFAFFAGFSTYLVVGLGGVSGAGEGLAAYEAYAPAVPDRAAVPAPDGAWTFEKHI